MNFQTYKSLNPKEQLMIDLMLHILEELKKISHWMNEEPPEEVVVKETPTLEGEIKI